MDRCIRQTTCNSAREVEEGIREQLKYTEIDYLNDDINYINRKNIMKAILEWVLGESDK